MITQQEQMLEKNKENIVKVIKWGIILIIIILLLKECGSTWKTLLKANKPVADTTIVHHRDTIWARDTTYVFKKIKVPVPYTIHDTIVNINGKDSCTNIKVYEDSLDDKNITIRYKDYVSQGDLIGKDLSYKLKVPLTIIDSIKEIIKVPTLYPTTFQLQGGLVLGSQIFAPEIGVSYKRHTLGLGYNMTNKQPIVRYSFVIFRK